MYNGDMTLWMYDRWASMKFINLVLAIFILGSLTSRGRQQPAEIHITPATKKVID